MADLIEQILARSSNPTPGSAVVSAVNADGTVNITVAGSDVPAPCLEGYTDRTVGDTVLVLPTRSGYVVLGRFTTA